MGLLSSGTPLPWEEAKNYADKVREKGVAQFINMFYQHKDRKTIDLKWGDEVEYIVLSLDSNAKKAKLSLRADEILDKADKAQDFHNVIWHPEYARFMVESTPKNPYGSTVLELLSVEANMQERRRAILPHLHANEFLLSLTCYPHLGVGSFTDPAAETQGPISHSLFVPDEAIGKHPRFPYLRLIFRTVTANIRKRRNRKVDINIPVFKDKHTLSPFVEQLPGSKWADACGAKKDHIYMDCMCFGMGCCCLQITFQAINIDEARYLNDQLAVLSPLMMALSASSPIFKGYLSGNDCRWTVISQSVDDRTAEELGLKPLKENRFVINKSRYDSIDSYLSTNSCNHESYSDLDLVYDHAIYKQLRGKGIDHPMARHVAHLFIRDPLVLYKELLEQNDNETADHFENIQSSNWQTVRFKPPPPGSDIGWRVEFRSMEVQLTDWENAAYSIFIVLVTRAILTYNLNFYIPISKVDENLKRAHCRDAVNGQKFYFRCNVFDGSDEYREMSMNEIINGSDDFIGLVPLVESFLDSLDVDIESRCALKRYLELIRGRADGSILTEAAYFRRFVSSHASYKFDSKVCDVINWDLMQECIAITRTNQIDRFLVNKQ